MLVIHGDHNVVIKLMIVTMFAYQLFVITDDEDGFFVYQKKPKGGGTEHVDHASEPEEESSGIVSFRSRTKGTKE